MYPKTNLPPELESLQERFTLLYYMVRNLLYQVVEKDKRGSHLAYLFLSSAFNRHGDRSPFTSKQRIVVFYELAKGMPGDRNTAISFSWDCRQALNPHEYAQVLSKFIDDENYQVVNSSIEWAFDYLIKKGNRQDSERRWETGFLNEITKILYQRKANAQEHYEPGFVALEKAEQSVISNASKTFFEDLDTIVRNKYIEVIHEPMLQFILSIRLQLPPSKTSTRWAENLLKCMKRQYPLFIVNDKKITPLFKKFLENHKEVKPLAKSCRDFLKELEISGAIDKEERIEALKTMILKRRPVAT